MSFLCWQDVSDGYYFHVRCRSHPHTFNRRSQPLCLAPFFFAAKRLLNQLDINFGFKSEAEERNRKRSAQTNTLFMRPDALLGAAVVVCTKHTWGLDGDIRHAHPKQDGAANEVPRSRAWVKALEQQEQMPKTQSQSELTR